MQDLAFGIWETAEEGESGRQGEGERAGFAMCRVEIGQRGGGGYRGDQSKSNQIKVNQSGSVLESGQRERLVKVSQA
jgi:hypothetical protein